MSFIGNLKSGCTLVIPLRHAAHRLECPVFPELIEGQIYPLRESEFAERGVEAVSRADSTRSEWKDKRRGCLSFFHRRRAGQWPAFAFCVTALSIASTTRCGGAEMH